MVFCWPSVPLFQRRGRCKIAESESFEERANDSTGTRQPWEPLGGVPGLPAELYGGGAPNLPGLSPASWQAISRISRASFAIASRGISHGFSFDPFLGGFGCRMDSCSVSLGRAVAEKGLGLWDGRLESLRGHVRVSGMGVLRGHVRCVCFAEKGLEKPRGRNGDNLSNVKHICANRVARFERAWAISPHKASYVITWELWLVVADGQAKGFGKHKHPQGWDWGEERLACKVLPSHQFIWNLTGSPFPFERKMVFQDPPMSGSM